MPHQDSTLTFGMVATKMGGLAKVSASVLLLGCIAGLAVVMSHNVEWAVGYTLITFPACTIIWLWSGSRLKGLPLLPVLAVQQMIIFSLPILVENPTLGWIRDSTVTAAGLAVALFLGGLLGGRMAACTHGGLTRGSKWNLNLAHGDDFVRRSIGICFLLLSVALLFQISNRTGLTYKLLPQSLHGAYPVIRSVAHSATMLGGFLGGVIIGEGRMPSAFKVLYWLAIILNGFLSIADVLISAGSSIVAAVSLGLLFGSRRLPWRFILIAFVIIGFFNQGKFVIRNRYWKDDHTSSARTMSQLPSFFLEWAQVSFYYLTRDEAPVYGNAALDKGQSILERVDNLQNLTFVLDVLEQGRKKPLEGQTYTLIPKLLVPRFLWPDKPRTHQGQILLNLYYGRQSDIEATEKTYIAWGLLPEAVGNFGRFWGPLLVGLVIGWLIGRLEAWSINTQLFSVEGIMMIVFFLMASLSYEMVASVLVTATFQSLVSSFVGGMIIYLWFNTARERSATPPPSFSATLLGHDATPVRGSRVPYTRHR